MITKIYTQEELERVIVETILNNTDKVTKVSDESVLSAFSYAMAKVAQKALKEVALVEAHLLPDAAYGVHLDTVAGFNGIPERYPATKSHTYVRLNGATGTTYTAGVHVFSGNGGTSFELLQTTSIGGNGYAYAPVRSLSTGASSKVNPFQINKVNPIPGGHISVFNEYMAVGGTDEESDEDFRRRIKNGANIGATGTLSRIEAIFQKINPSILRVLFYGLTSDQKIKLGVVTRDGGLLNTTELNTLINGCNQYLCLTEYSQQNLPGIAVVNVEKYEIDVEIWLSTNPSVSTDQIRKDIQVQFSKYVDWRFWDWTKKVEWDNLLEIVKRTYGVEYVSDHNFIPNTDIMIQYNVLPVFRSFLIKDLSGNIISDNNGIQNPVFYQVQSNTDLQNIIVTI